MTASQGVQQWEVWYERKIYYLKKYYVVLHTILENYGNEENVWRLNYENFVK